MNNLILILLIVVFIICVLVVLFYRCQRRSANGWSFSLQAEIEKKCDGGLKEKS